MRLIKPAAPSRANRPTAGSRKPARKRIASFAEPNAESVSKHALETFGTNEKLESWMNRRNPIFGNATPREMIALDPRAVEVELTRIDHGIYV